MSFQFNMKEITHPVKELHEAQVNKLRLKYDRKFTSERRSDQLNEYDEFVIEDPKRNEKSSPMRATNQLELKEMQLEKHEEQFVMGEEQTSFKVETEEGDLVA